MIGPTCSRCGFIHSSTDAIAVGRFNPRGVDGYRSTLMPDAPLRATRAEAVNDGCNHRRPTPISGQLSICWPESR